MDELACLEPEHLADPANPANDGYYETLRGLRALADAAAQRMRRKHVAIVRQAHAGKLNTDIAREFNVSQNTVGNVLRRDDAKNLLSLLRHAEHLIEGPRLELRRNVLWRIAQRSELEDPGMTINAIKELNKLAGAYPLAVAPTPTQVNVVINGEMLPRTALDQG